MMSTALPITINIAKQLQHHQTTISGVANKLEALFNFRTMTAGWFGDEDKILTIAFTIETAQGLDEKKTTFEQQAQEAKLHQLSDDAFVLFNLAELNIFCVIAITDSELVLIESTPKLLQPLLDKKVVKVLNVIAEQQKLFPIE